MQIKNGKDFWAGLMFIGFGLGFILVSFNYPMGSARRMGPAYFPTVVGVLLTIVGGLTFLRAFVSKIKHPFKVLTFRPLLLIASIVVGAGTYLAGSWLNGAPMTQSALGGLGLVLFLGAFGPRSMFLILLAVVIFGYTLKPLGLVLATVIMTVLSAAAGHDFRKKEIMPLAIALVLFGVLVFAKGLELPLNLWPGR